MSGSFDPARLRALLFDLDGTLADTDDHYVGRLTRWLPGQNAARLARRLVMASETPGNALLAAFDRLGLDTLAAPLADGWHRVRGEGRPLHFPIIPGVRAMLEALHGRYLMAIVSSRDARGVQAFLEQHALRPFFDCVASGRTCARAKPHPAPVRWAADQLGVAPAACLMVGDTTVDIRAGRAAGAQTAGVLCGFGEADELAAAGADLILISTADLAGVLRARDANRPAT